MDGTGYFNQQAGSNYLYNHPYHQNSSPPARRHSPDSAGTLTIDPPLSIVGIPYASGTQDGHSQLSNAYSDNLTEQPSGTPMSYIASSMFDEQSAGFPNGYTNHPYYERDTFVQQGPHSHPVLQGPILYTYSVPVVGGVYNGDPSVQVASGAESRRLEYHPNLVPQRRYVAARQPSPPEDPKNMGRVEFTHDGGHWGISLDPSSEDIRGLDQPEDRTPFENFKQKAFYRIEWPGYKSHSAAKHVRGAKGPITRSAIVQHVIEVTEAFIRDNEHYIPTEPGWKVGGPEGIEIHDLILLGVDLVSTASAQPVFAVRSHQ